MATTKKNVTKKPTTKKVTHKPDKAKWNKSYGGAFVDMSQVELVNKPKA